ncbi:MAG: hypothetical protein ACRELA_04925, partial [Candidatus Rokuibacteriota bacterium]
MAPRVLALMVLVALPSTAAAAGSVVGAVVFRGDVPAPASLEVSKDHETCGTEVPADALVVEPGTRGVASAVVWIEGLTGAPATPPEARLENRRCRFVPRVLALQVGTELSIVNADPVLHNLRAWLDRRAVLNVVQPTQGQVTQRTIKRAGPMALT